MRHMTNQEMIDKGILIPIDQETDKKFYVITLDGKQYKVPYP